MLPLPHIVRLSGHKFCVIGATLVNFLFIIKISIFDLVKFNKVALNHQHLL
jgi:hypothetical protein